MKGEKWNIFLHRENIFLLHIIQFWCFRTKKMISCYIYAGRVAWSNSRAANRLFMVGTKHSAHSEVRLCNMIPWTWQTRMVVLLILLFRMYLQIYVLVFQHHLWFFVLALVVVVWEFCSLTVCEDVILVFGIMSSKYNSRSIR